MRTREDFHKLIDRIQDEEILKGYFKLIEKLNNSQSGELWNSLNDEEKVELLLSYDESFNTNILISHEQVQKQHTKWLKK